jgi:hypothetical protein
MEDMKIASRILEELEQNVKNRSGYYQYLKAKSTELYQKIEPLRAIVSTYDANVKKREVMRNGRFTEANLWVYKQ